MVSISHPPTKNIARLMVFVDGGYLRQNFKQKYETDYLDYNKIINCYTQLIPHS